MNMNDVFIETYCKPAATSLVLSESDINDIRRILKGGAPVQVQAAPIPPPVQVQAAPASELRTIKTLENDLAAKNAIIDNLITNANISTSVTKEIIDAKDTLANSLKDELTVKEACIDLLNKRIIACGSATAPKISNIIREYLNSHKVNFTVKDSMETVIMDMFGNCTIADLIGEPNLPLLYTPVQIIEALGTFYSTNSINFDNILKYLGGYTIIQIRDAYIQIFGVKLDAHNLIYEVKL